MVATMKLLWKFIHRSIIHTIQFRNSAVLFLVVKSRLSRVLAADSTVMIGDRLDRPTRLGSIFATWLDSGANRSTRSIPGSSAIASQKLYISGSIFNQFFKPLAHRVCQSPHLLKCFVRLTSPDHYKRRGTVWERRGTIFLWVVVRYG